MITIETVKNEMDQYLGKEMHFFFRGTRNQTEEFFGTITNTYPSVFIIRLRHGQFIKSFSYSDVLTHKLVISGTSSTDLS